MARAVNSLGLLGGVRTALIDQMPLALTTFSESPVFVGYTWNIADEKKLVRILTLLVVGDHFHAHEILRGTPGHVAPPMPTVLDRAARDLRQPKDRYHRDGWLFQLMSWIAIQRAASTGAIIRAPQPRMADKGLAGEVGVTRAPRTPPTTDEELRSLVSLSPDL